MATKTNLDEFIAANAPLLNSAAHHKLYTNGDDVIGPASRPVKWHGYQFMFPSGDEGVYIIEGRCFNCSAKYTLEVPVGFMSPQPVHGNPYFCDVCEIASVYAG